MLWTGELEGPVLDCSVGPGLQASARTQALMRNWEQGYRDMGLCP